MQRLRRQLGLQHRPFRCIDASPPAPSLSCSRPLRRRVNSSDALAAAEHIHSPSMRAAAVTQQHHSMFAPSSSPRGEVVELAALVGGGGAAGGSGGKGSGAGTPQHVSKVSRAGACWCYKRNAVQACASQLMHRANLFPCLPRASLSSICRSTRLCSRQRRPCCWIGMGRRAAAAAAACTSGPATQAEPTRQTGSRPRRGAPKRYAAGSRAPYDWRPAARWCQAISP